MMNGDPKIGVAVFFAALFRLFYIVVQKICKSFEPGYKKILDDIQTNVHY